MFELALHVACAARSRYDRVDGCLCMTGAMGYRRLAATRDSHPSHLPALVAHLVYHLSLLRYDSTSIWAAREISALEFHNTLLMRAWMDEGHSASTMPALSPSPHVLASETGKAGLMPCTLARREKVAQSHAASQLMSERQVASRTSVS